MAEERIVVEFTTQGLPQTQQDITNLQDSAIGGFTELKSKLDLIQVAFGTVQQVAGSLYEGLIASNEKLNQELLKSQVALASTLEIYKGSNQVTDITEKIQASQGALRESLKQIEIDTTELVGVTTEQVNGIFQILLQNASSFIGQSKEFANPIDAATASTKGWAAALGTLGLPLEQANQEIRSILQGDVNNPDSVIAKTLAISREQYDQWVANGVLIDKINEKLAVYVEGNKLASQSVGAITSNIQSFFEDTARMATEPLLAPVVSALNDVYKLLNDNRKLIEELAGENVKDLIALFDTFRDSVAKITDSLNIEPQGFLKGGSELIGNIIGALEGLLNLGSSLVALFGPTLGAAFSNAFQVLNFGLEGVGALANGLAAVIDYIAKLTAFTEPLNKLFSAFNLAGLIEGAQTAIAQVTGKFDDAAEATATYRDITASLVAQTDKMVASGNASSAMIAGQITALKEQKESLKGLQTFREADKISQQQQLEAIDKSIKSLEKLGNAQDELTFKAPELAKLGTMMELLGKNADAALATINREGGGKKEVFEEAVKSLTELTAKQVEYGQITAEEGIKQLDGIVNNSKVELETREAALEEMKRLQEDFTKFKVSQLDREAEAVERAVKRGQLSEIEGARAGADIAKRQSDLELESIDKQIEKAKQLGQSTEQLAAQREEITSKQADKELATIEKVEQLREEAAQKSYEAAVSLAEESEQARLLALEKSLASKQISEDKYDADRIKATQERLAAELAAEQANLLKLQELRASATTADQQEALDDKIAESRKKATDLEIQAVQAQAQAQKQAADAQKKAADEAKKAIEEKIKGTKEAYDRSVSDAQLAEGKITTGLKQQLADRKITQEQYDKQAASATQTRLQAELEANANQLEKLEAIAASQKDNQSAQDAVTEAKKRQIAITQELLDLDISGQKATSEAVKKALAQRLEAIEKGYAANQGKAEAQEQTATLALQKALAARKLSQEQYDNRVLELRKARLESEVKAEQSAIDQLSKIKVGGKEQEDIQNRITEAKKRSKAAQSELLEIEMTSKDRIIDAYRTQLEEKLKGINIGYDEQEARIRKTEKNEADAQVKLTQLAVSRIKAQMAAEEEAAKKLAALGDKKGAAEKKLDLRKLAINLIDAEIKAEDALQNKLKNELELLRKRLDLKKGDKEINLLGDELKLAEAVKAGTMTKEQAEKRKLELARARIEAELELLQGLEGKGEASDKQKNIQDQLKAKIELAEIDKQIADFGKQQTTAATETKKVETETVDVLKQQQDALKRSTESRLAALELQKLQLTQLVALSELEAQSVARVGQLRASQATLIAAQLSSLESGLGNELSLVNAALSARTKLSEVEKQLATDEKLTSEQRVALEKEAVALKAQLGALGSEGGKSELQLIEQRMQAEQRQIQVKREQLALSAQQGEIERANQRAAIELDKVRADFKAREMALETRKLEIQAQQLEAQSRLTKDAAEAASLQEQAQNIRQQAENTKELSEAQQKAASEEAALREKMLDNQTKIAEIQTENQEKTLDTQQKLLDSQQAYERSIKGLKPKIDTRSVDEFAAKIKDIRSEIQKVATVQMPALKLTPGNLNVKIADDRSLAPLNNLNRSARTQIDYLASVKASVAPLAGKMDQVVRAVKAGGTGGSASSDTTVKNQITVNVAPGAKATVTTKELIEKRKKEGKC